MVCSLATNYDVIMKGVHPESKNIWLLWTWMENIFVRNFLKFLVISLKKCHQ